MSRKPTDREYTADSGEEGSDGEPVGYGRPPKQHQFKPGKSGNPKGRPKGRKSESAMMKGLLNERVQVREGGRLKWMSRREVLARHALNNTPKNGLKSFLLYAAIDRMTADENHNTGIVDEETRRARDRRIADYIRRHPQGPKADDSEGET